MFKTSLSLCAIALISCQLLFSQVPDVQMKPWRFDQIGAEDPNPYGNLSLSIPLTSLKNGTGLQYDLNLYYKSGIRYFDYGGEVGVGWSLSQFKITRIVRGYPDESEYWPVYDWIFNPQTNKMEYRVMGYKRLGKFGWLDYRDYSKKSDGSTANIDEPEFHGYGSWLAKDYTNPLSTTEVEDYHYLTSPVASGRLVYHHFEVDYARTDGQYHITCGRLYESLGLIPQNYDPLPPRYRVYFFLENNRGVRAILHIDKSSYHWTDCKTNSLWWEVFDSEGNRYVFGDETTSALERRYTDVSVPLVKKRYKNADQTTYTRIETAWGVENGQMSVDQVHRLEASATHWYLSRMENPAFKDNSICFTYDAVQYQYERVNDSYFGDPVPADRQETESVIVGEGLRGTTEYVYLKSVETRDQILEFSYRTSGTLPAHRRFLTFVRCKNKPSNSYFRQWELKYQNQHSLNLSDWPTRYLDGLDAAGNELRDRKVLLVSIAESGIRSFGGGTLVADQSKPPYMFEYNLFGDGATSISNPDMWGFDNMRNPFNPYINEVGTELSVPISSKYRREYDCRTLQDVPGNLSNLEYRRGQPFSANWSMKAVTYPQGVRKEFFYAPAGEQKVWQVGNDPTKTTAPFESELLASSWNGIFDPTSTSHVTEETATRTIGGPPVLVRVKTTNGTEQFFTNFEYKGAKASGIPYAYLNSIISFDANDPSGGTIIGIRISKGTMFHRVHGNPLA